MIFLEHKLLSESWLEFLGRGGRTTVSFDVPAEGAQGEVADAPAPVPIGEAAVVRPGKDLTAVSLCVGVHRTLAAAERLAQEGMDVEVVDLRTVRALDRKTVAGSARKTGRVLVVDEDYAQGGLSGEIAAVTLEAQVAPRFARVCVEDTLPFARPLEDRALPNVERIVESARALAGRAG